MSIVKIPSFGDLELKRLGFLSNKPIFYKIVHKFSCRTIYNIEVPSLSPADEFRRQTALYGVDIMANVNKTALLRPVGENTSLNPDARAVARIKRVDGRGYGKPFRMRADFSGKRGLLLFFRGKRSAVFSDVRFELWRIFSSRRK